MGFIGRRGRPHRRVKPQVFILRLFQKPQKGLTCSAIQFLGVQGPIMIWVRGIEALLDQGKILPALLRY
jgi:hypothetical protein